MSSTDASAGRPAGAFRLRRAAFIAGVALASALLAAAIAWQVVLHLSEQRLGAQSSMLLDRAQALDQEVRHTLDRFNRQPSALCSGPEFEQMREVVYGTAFVKDIGRVRDGTLVCTASLWQLGQPVEVPAAQLTTVDGWQVASMELKRLASGSRAPVIGLGATRVILDPLAFHQLPSMELDFMVGYLDDTGARFLPLYGRPMRLEAGTLRAGRPLDHDGVLSYPLCDARGSVCVVSALSKRTLVSQQWPLLLVCTLLGGLAGTAVGLALRLAHLRRHSLEGRLQQVIAQDGREVEYQPIVGLADGVIVGAEALVRWRDRDGRMVSPARFIPIAEENGSVQLITLQVLHRIVRDLGDLLTAPGDFRVNLNISAADLDNDRFHAAMAQVLEHAGIAHDRIGIELTEHSTAARETAVSGTARLRELGHRVYIDDFGTGYSSLSYLAQLHIHALKIDRSFTCTIGTDALKVTLVPQIIELARTLGLQVVVEGVETEAQVAYLRAIPYPLQAQGWAFGRPMPHAAFREVLAAQE